MGNGLGEKGKPEIGPHTAVSHPVSKSYDFDFLFRPQANLSFLGEPTIMESEKVFFVPTLFPWWWKGKHCSEMRNGRDNLTGQKRQKGNPEVLRETFRNSVHNTHKFLMTYKPAPFVPQYDIKCRSKNRPPTFSFPAKNVRTERLCGAKKSLLGE